MKIRLGLWQDIDLDEMRTWMKENDYLVPDDTTDDTIIDYLYNRMSEDIDTMVKYNEVSDNLMHEEI